MLNKLAFAKHDKDIGKSYYFMEESTWIHLRLPFSFRLAPVFLFAWSQMSDPFSPNALCMFFLLHFLLYPASNGYNSYFDKDEDSIAGVEVPPPVTDNLYYVSLALDAIALVISALWVNTAFFVFAFIYGGISKLYSHPATRFKAMPVFGWLIIGIFQGYLVFMGIQGGSSQGLAFFRDPRLQMAGILSSLIPLGMYPLTQVYQHKEDKRRGDITISILLGIRGTFILASILFFLTFVGFCGFFTAYYPNPGVIILTSTFCMAPAVIYFANWFALVVRDEKYADFKNTMRMSLVGAVCMNTCYAWLTFFQSSNQKYL